MDHGRPLHDPFDLHDAVYEPWQPPAVAPRDRWFEADDGARLHDVEWPADPGAPTVALIHGRRAHARWFDPIVPYLSPRYRLISLDLRGHGESASRGPAELKRYAADVAEWLHQDGGRPLAVMAHSMAGRIVILAAELHGLRPDLLLMVDAPIYRRPHHARPEAEFKMKRYPDREAAIARFRLMPPGTTAHPDCIRYIAEHSIRRNEDGSWSWRFDERGSTRPFGADFPDADQLALERITCPTLVVYGEHSLLVDAEEARRTAERFPRGRVVELADAYHHLMLDRPRAFSRLALDFFAAAGF